MNITSSTTCFLHLTCHLLGNQKKQVFYCEVLFGQQCTMKGGRVLRGMKDLKLSFSRQSQEYFFSCLQQFNFASSKNLYILHENCRDCESFLLVSAGPPFLTSLLAGLLTVGSGASIPLQPCCPSPQILGRQWIYMSVATYKNCVCSPAVEMAVDKLRGCRRQSRLGLERDCKK